MIWQTMEAKVSANPILEVFYNLFWAKAWQGRKPVVDLCNFIQVYRSVAVFNWSRIKAFSINDLA